MGAIVNELEIENMPMVRTSEPGWLAQVAKAYRNREQIVIMDDANAGIDPSGQTLLQMGLSAGFLATIGSECALPGAWASGAL
jgi:hypothetical protein